jgi:hypothetical protein
MTKEEMVEQFICPGCVGGSDTKCGSYEPNPRHKIESTCIKHVVGTSSLGFGSFALGLPKGFCRAGFEPITMRHHNTMYINCWLEGTHPDWDKLNVPVWAMEEDGFLYVRTYSPRINEARTDVIEKGTLALVPGAVDVGKFIEEID